MTPIQQDDLAPQRPCLAHARLYSPPLLLRRKSIVSVVYDIYVVRPAAIATDCGKLLAAEDLGALLFAGLRERLHSWVKPRVLSRQLRRTTCQN